MTNFLQINLNCCKVAQQLLLQTATEKEADVLIICEQNRSLPHWYTDTDGKAAIALHQNVIPEELGNPGKGYVWVRIGGIRIYSCYVSPNITLTEYKAYLGRLEASIRAGSGEVILAGDFNAKSAEWGSTVTDQRGDELSSLIASLDLSVCNRGKIPTFERGVSRSILDVTFASHLTARQVRDWKVLNEETRSDHKYLFFKLDTYTERGSRVSAGWSWKKLNPEKMEKYLNEQEHPRDAQELMEIMRGACDAAMPRRKQGRSHHKPQYWWTREIADLRKATFTARRSYQKAARRGPAEEEKRKFKETKKTLRVTIRRSQENCWKKLCAEVDRDPWGTPYRMVMRKIGRRPPVPTDMIPAIIAELFPTHPPTEETVDQTVTHIPPMTFQELELASKRLHPGKAPGPDGVPNEALKIAVKTQPTFFQEALNRCMTDGVFPKTWKRARLVLLRKGDKPADQPSSYRPLCMLDTTGKLFERILCNRIEEALVNEGTNLANNQYGFRKGRSTIDAIERVMTEVADAGTGTIYKRELCVLVTLDVANAFNSASWNAIIRAMENKKVPGYLIRTVRNYLCDREITYGDDQTTVQLSSGVPQGSVLGPLLWGIMYDGLLTKETPDGVTLVGFADDVAIVGRAMSTQQLEESVNRTLQMVQDWMNTQKLRLALQKTEAVMLTRKRDYRKPIFTLEGQQIATKNSLRYLGIEIDVGRRFKVHEQKVGAKAMRTAQALTRILPNIGGSSTAKRKLLTSVVHSQILYAAPIWSPLLYHRPNSTVPIKGDVAKHIKSAQRLMALRVTRAYRTVSYEAVTLIASMPPIKLLAKERIAIRNATDKCQTARDARKDTMKEWQREWEKAENGRWTYTLISNIEKWANRKHGDLDHFLTQVLTNHGCFNAYLHRMKKLETPKCSWCEADTDDANHTLFVCDAFENWRRVLVGEIGHDLTAANIVDTMLECRSKWNLIVYYINKVMRHKCDAERQQQSSTRNTQLTT